MSSIAPESCGTVDSPIAKSFQVDSRLHSFFFDWWRHVPECGFTVRSPGVNRGRG
jgi:hypothetical protein